MFMNGGGSKIFDYAVDGAKEDEHHAQVQRYERASYLAGGNSSPYASCMEDANDDAEYGDYTDLQDQ